MIHPDDVPRFARVSATANIQPLWATHEPQMDELTIPFLGERRAGWQYPFRSLEAAGAAMCALAVGIPVSDVARGLGFTPSAFSTFFKSHVGEAPSRWLASQRARVGERLE